MSRRTSRSFAYRTSSDEHDEDQPAPEPRARSSVSAHSVEPLCEDLGLPNLDHNHSVALRLHCERRWDASRVLSPKSSHDASRNSAAPRRTIAGSPACEGRRARVLFPRLEARRLGWAVILMFEGCRSSNIAVQVRAEVGNVRSGECVGRAARLLVLPAFTFLTTP
jgi:hypothetical protein